MTPQEAEQMALMYQWAATEPTIQFLQLKTFKQCHAKTKEVKTWLTIECLFDKDNKWSSITGVKSQTLTGAMENFSQQWGAKQ